MIYQLSPAGIHRSNWDERAIKTIKNRFIAGLCSTDPKLPINLWCKLFSQSIITLNLLRPSEITSKLCTHAQVFGNFNYDHTFMAPPGIKFPLHGRPEDHGSWSPHALSGSYIVPILEHYR